MNNNKYAKYLWENKLTVATLDLAGLVFGGAMGAFLSIGVDTIIPKLLFQVGMPVYCLIVNHIVFYFAYKDKLDEPLS